MNAINISLKDTIKDITSKRINVTKIYKNNIANNASIEIETTEPTQYITLLYKTQQERDNDWNLLDDKVFWSLPFNPNLYEPQA